MLIGAVRASDTKATRDVVLFAIGRGRRDLHAAGVRDRGGRAGRGAGLEHGAPQARADRGAARSRSLSLALVRVDARRDPAATPTRSSVAGSRSPRRVTGAYHHLAAPTVANAMPFALHSTLGEVATFLVIMLLTIVGRRPPVPPRRPRAARAPRWCRSSSRTSCSSPAHFYVQPRFASYLLFHVLVVLAIGVQTAVGAAGRRPARAGGRRGRARARRAGRLVTRRHRHARRRRACRGRTTSSSPTSPRRRGSPTSSPTRRTRARSYYYLGRKHVYALARGRDRERSRSAR